MANAMNFSKASSDPSWISNAIKRRIGTLPANSNTNLNPSETINPGKPTKSGSSNPPWHGGYNRPVAPGKSGNASKDKVLNDLYQQNRKTYNATKKNKTYKSKYIKTGGGLVDSDFGEGTRGAGIPYQIGEKSTIKTTNDKILSEADKKAAEAKAKMEAIKRRQEKEKKK